MDKACKTIPTLSRKFARFAHPRAHSSNIDPIKLKWELALFPITAAALLHCTDIVRNDRHSACAF